MADFGAAGAARFIENAAHKGGSAAAQTGDLVEPVVPRVVKFTTFGVPPLFCMVVMLPEGSYPKAWNPTTVPVRVFSITRVSWEGEMSLSQQGILYLLWSSSIFPETCDGILTSSLAPPFGLGLRTKLQPQVSQSRATSDNPIP